MIAALLRTLNAKALQQTHTMPLGQLPLQCNLATYISPLSTLTRAAAVHAMGFHPPPRPLTLLAARPMLHSTPHCTTSYSHVSHPCLHDKCTAQTAPAPSDRLLALPLHVSLTTYRLMTLLSSHHLPSPVPPHPAQLCTHTGTCSSQLKGKLMRVHTHTTAPRSSKRRCIERLGPCRPQPQWPLLSGDINVPVFTCCTFNTLLTACLISVAVAVARVAAAHAAAPTNGGGNLRKQGCEVWPADLDGHSGAGGLWHSANKNNMSASGSVHSCFTETSRDKHSHTADQA